MYKTLRISFSLKNTYRVNSILYSLKQIPVLGKAFPEALYQVRGLKVFANVISIIWEIISAFLGKFLYFLFMIMGASLLYPSGVNSRLFLHILVVLTMIGANMNTYMFNPTRDKYYALLLMRMNSREFTLINYGYAILKVLAGFLVFGIIFGLKAGVPLWQCVLIPFFVAGAKMSMAGYSLWRYERTGKSTNENVLSKWEWAEVFLFMAAAYVLPGLEVMLPEEVSVGIMGLSVLTGIAALIKILNFKEYYEVYKEILTQSLNQAAEVKQVVREQNRKIISADTGITSRKRGFEFLNELFIKRHRKILWRSAKRITLVCLCLTAAAILGLHLAPAIKEEVNRTILHSLPYFTFIMYMVNRGTGFTNALFINCDHSLLTYSIYKQPKYILKLFHIRLREIVKVNLLPAAVIGLGLSAVLYVSGGTDNVLNYGVLVVSIMSMSVFFSVHYLTIYYLLQPYNAGTEMKSASYQIVSWGTYFVCFYMMQLRLPVMLFGGLMIVFCVIYSIVACVLVYRLASLSLIHI